MCVTNCINVTCSISVLQLWKRNGPKVALALPWLAPLLIPVAHYIKNSGISFENASKVDQVGGN
jgi:hypothetical protein